MPYQRDAVKHFVCLKNTFCSQAFRRPILTWNILDLLENPLQHGRLPPFFEPASWAMMIGGFGMIGAAMRRQRKAAVRFG